MYDSSLIITLARRIMTRQQAGDHATPSPNNKKIIIVVNYSMKVMIGLVMQIYLVNCDENYTIDASPNGGR